MSNTIKRLLVVGALLAIFTAAFGVSAPAYAQPELPDRYADRLADLQPVNGFEGKHPSLNNATGNLTVVVELTGDSGVATYAAMTAQGASNADVTADVQATIDAALETQAVVRSRLSAINAVELGSVQRTMNAMILNVPANNIDRLAAMPEVVSVAPAPIHTIGQNSSLPYLEVPDVWENQGNTGAGTSIGIIDTGIDYLHLGFGGTGSYVTQTDPTTLSDTPASFPTAKVIGGYDFVGDDYNASSGDPAAFTPFPDEDPTDCNGHGSHVAGTAAGYGVQNGATYTGSYDTALDLDSFDVPPGVAPDADLYALKVFGCDGSTNVTLLAIEYSVDPNQDGDFSDHMDVINLSLGGIYGDPAGTNEQAINAVAEIGVIPVIAAGNDGEAYFVNGGPGVATRGISVAAINDGSETALEITDGAVTTAGVPASFGADWGEAAITGAEIVLPNAGGASEGCEAADFDSAIVNGKVVLVDRGSCTFVSKAQNAQAAGATHVIITNVTTEVPIIAGGDDTDDPVTVPVAMISGTAGDYIKSELGNGAVTLDITPDAFPLGNTIASFTSMGPVRPNADGEILLKPDIASVGTNVTSVLTGYVDGPGDAPLTIGGTSMATPHVAGMMAMLAAEYPDAPVEVLKAKIMNTANGSDDPTTNIDTPPVSVARIGAGVSNVGDALDTCVFMWIGDGSGAVSVAFDTVEVTEDKTDTEAVWIANECDTDIDVDSSAVVLNADASGIEFTVPDLAGATLSANSTIMVDVEATYTYADMLHDRQQALIPAQGSLADRHWIGEEGGYFEVTLAGGDTLILPMFSAARPASQMEAGTVSASPGAAEVGLTGTGILNSPDAANALDPDVLPFSNVSLVTGFELLLEDANESPFSDDPWDAADIRKLGVSNDGFETFIGFEMWDSWASMGLDANMYFCLDLDQDGTGGAFGDGTDFCYVILDPVALGGSPDDAAEVWLWDINGWLGGGLFPWDYVNYLPGTVANTRQLNSSVGFVAVQHHPAFWGGLVTSGEDVSTAFDMYAYTDNFRNPDFPTDETPTVTYEPDRATLNAAYDTGLASILGLPVQIDADGSSGLTYDLPEDDPDAGPITIDTGAFGFTHNSCDPSEATSALLLHHHNPEATRGEAVDIAWTVPDECPEFTGAAVASYDMANIAIDLAWPAPTDADSATVERRVVGNGQWALIAAAPAADVATGFTDTMPVCGNEYEYRITLYADGYGFVDFVTNSVAVDCSGLFTDVPSANQPPVFADWIHAMYQSGISTGCNGGDEFDTLAYCPETVVDRGSMAVFLVRAINYPDTSTPADDTSDPFADVPSANQPPIFEFFIEEFFNLGVTTGCGTNVDGEAIYCPEETVDRGQMAVFILRALGIDPVDDPSDPFADVPSANQPPAFEAYIETFYNLGITTGCGTDVDGNLLYCPETEVDRGQMAVFILRAFDSIPDPEDP